MLQTNSGQISDLNLTKCARVVSQRFRQFCLKAGIKASFVPIQIED